MGAWGFKPLENDDAQDLLGNFNDSKNITLLENVLDRVCNLRADAYLEAPEASEAVAVAQIINNLKDDEITVEDRSRLIEKSNKALKKILEISELKELWSESPEYEQWSQSVKNLIH